MIRLGVRLAVRSGREALVRLVVITAAVGIGVGLLLCVLAIYHGYQASAAKPCWQCLVERRRPFTLLRVSGVPVRVLYRTVLLETILPLVTATLVAAGVGLLLALPIARALAPQRRVLTVPAASYYVTLGASLAIALVVIVACLPILGRITRTDQARFE